MSWWDNRRRLRLWQKALEPCKVGTMETSAFWERHPRLTARSDSIELRITRAGGSDDRVAVETGDGRFRVEVSEKELPRTLAALFNIGRGSAEPLEAKSLLLHKARRDPDPEVRLYNLLVLIREHPGDPDTLAVLRGACIDPISKVRVRAAIELGDEGRDVVLRIAERSSDDASCALAVSHLGSTLPLERVRDILARALRRGFLQMTRACLEVLGKSRDPAAFDVLAEVLTREKGELAAAAAETLGATGSPAAEPALLLALQREEMDLRMAAANALGRIGSAVAVLPLREAAESVDDPDFGRTTRRAIAEIQSRLEGAAPGQLSLAGTEAGQLSLAAEAGQLSLAQAEAGQLTLPPEEPEEPAVGPV